MKSFRYITYSDIPEGQVDYILTVSGLKSIFQLSMTEINNFLNDTKHYYDEQNGRNHGTNYPRIQRFQ